MHARERTAHHGKARTGDLGGRVEIELTQCRADVDMIPGIEIECTRLAPAPHFDIVVLIAPFRHAGVRNIRHTEQQLIEFILNLRQLGLGLLELVAEIGDFSQQRRGVLPLCLGLADGLGARVALVLQILSGDLRRFATGLERADACGVENKATTRQLRGGSIEIGTE